MRARIVPATHRLRSAPELLLPEDGIAAPGEHGRRILYYHDPMHPSYRSDRPGIAPDCNMELTPVYADDSAERRPGT